ncbi:MAG: hypothetical protein ACRD2J_07135 [Thermoanaerobaculia bacterium]
MALDDSFRALSEFLHSLDEEGEQKFELSHSLVIICPDCGKNIAFRNRCPKCGGNSWIPAGHAGGVFEQMKAQRWREMVRMRPEEPEFEEGNTGGFESAGGAS